MGALLLPTAVSLQIVFQNFFAFISK